MNNTCPPVEKLRIIPRRRANPYLRERGHAALAEAVLKQAFADSPTRCRSETCGQCMEQECSLKWLMQESTALTLWCHVAGVSPSTVTMIAHIQREKLHA